MPLKFPTAAYPTSTLSSTHTTETFWTAKQDRRRQNVQLQKKRRLPLREEMPHFKYNLQRRNNIGNKRQPKSLHRVDEQHVQDFIDTKRRSAMKN